jgi:hypothetical protein
VSHLLQQRPSGHLVPPPLAPHFLSDDNDPGRGGDGDHDVGEGLVVGDAESSTTTTWYRSHSCSRLCQLYSWSECPSM